MLENRTVNCSPDLSRLVEERNEEKLAVESKKDEGQVRISMNGKKNGNNEEEEPILLFW
jgi:hypothetical protein